MSMKVCIVGMGFAGAACTQALSLRGSCHEVALFDTRIVEIDNPDPGSKQTVQLDQGLANDLSQVEVLCPTPTNLA